MAQAVLELNDHALLLQSRSGELHSEPGFARLTAEGIETGEIARATAWSEPQHSYNQFWCHLNQTPMASRQKWARHHADIAFAQLGKLWREAGSPGELALLVPGSFSDSRLSLLLGMVGALPAETAAVVDSGLAACMAVERETLYVDMQLHQSVLTVCRPESDSVRIADQEVFPDLGIMQILNSAARHISRLLIDSARYDPLHASASEQAIYDQLPDWLARLRWDGEVSDTLVSDKGELPFILRRDEIAGLLGERLVNARSFMSRHPGADLLVSHSSSVLAGLVDEFAEAEVADRLAAVSNFLSGGNQVPVQQEGLHRVRSLGRTRRGARVDGQKEQLATHLLCGDRALPLNRPVSVRLENGSLELASGLDNESELTVVIRNRSLERVRSAQGSDAVLPDSCRPGESIVVGGHRLKLIEVRE